MDKKGNVKEEHLHFPLYTLMMNCTYSKEEKLATEVLLGDLFSNSISNQMISFLVFPKYHCKLLGDSVNYDWGLNKKFSQEEVLKTRNTKKIERVVRKKFNI